VRLDSERAIQERGTFAHAKNTKTLLVQCRIKAATIITDLQGDMFPLLRE